jgi:ketosteroid isomerase-like protein
MSGPSQQTLDELRARQAAVIRALSSQDHSFFVTHYTDGSTRFHETGDLDARAPSEMAHGLKAMFGAGARFDIENHEVVGIQVRDSVAICTGYIDGALELPNGTRGSERLRFTYVWARESDGWKELHHHVSPR